MRSWSQGLSSIDWGRRAISSLNGFNSASSKKSLTRIGQALVIKSKWGRWTSCKKPIDKQLLQYKKPHQPRCRSSCPPKGRFSLISEIQPEQYTNSWGIFTSSLTLSLGGQCSCQLLLITREWSSGVKHCHHYYINSDPHSLSPFFNSGSIHFNELLRSLLKDWPYKPDRQGWTLGPHNDLR